MSLYSQNQMLNWQILDQKEPWGFNIQWGELNPITWYRKSDIL